VKVLAFTRYGARAASTRQRLLQYLPALAAAGIEVEHHALLGDDYVQNLEDGTGFSRSAIARAYLARIDQLIRRRADLIWVYAELFPYLPGAFEKLAFASAKPVILDMDDAFFHAYDRHARPAIRRFLGNKLDPLFAGAAACTLGNEYLAAHAGPLNDRTIIMPTVVNGDLYQPDWSTIGSRAPTIGWIGSPSTYRYLRPILPLLRSLAERHGARILIIGAGDRVQPEDRHPAIEFRPWQEAAEVSDLQAMSIGIMPLPDEEWAYGKSGYKLIQYMACGLPVVASPVGVNSNIVENGRTGFLATSTSEWHVALTCLLEQPGLGVRQGQAGRERFEGHYSLAVHAPRLVEVFRDAVSGRSRPSVAAA
jgi:glycosyltransferase involved in cell wall biosynthesis